MQKILLLTICAFPLISAGAEPTPDSAPKSDRVGFPKDYQATYEVLRTVLRPEKKEVVTVYGNVQAAKVSRTNDLPYSYGSVLVMETAKFEKDFDFKPGTVPAKKPTQEQVVGLHVMKKDKDFGVDYQAKRSGEWEYTEYKADGSYITPPEKSASCSECHIKAGPEKDFVYEGKLSKPAKSP